MSLRQRQEGQALLSRCIRNVNAAPIGYLAGRGRAHALRQGRRSAQQLRRHRAVGAGGAPHGRPAERRQARLRGVGRRGALAHLQQHRPRSADGCRHRRHGPCLLDRHGMLDQHDGRDRSGRHDRRRCLQSRLGGRRRQPEPRAGRAGTTAVGLAAQVPAGPLARPEARPCHARPAQGHQALHPGDRQSHDGPQHGRAYRNHRQGMADRPPGAGRDRPAKPTRAPSRAGTRASSTTW